MTFDPDSFAARLDSASTPEELARLEAELAAAEQAAGIPNETDSGSRPAWWIVGKLGDVALWFGVELQTVKQWRTEADPMPGEPGERGQPGRYDLREITRWRVRKAERGAVNQQGAVNADLKRRKEELEIEELELDLHKKRGDLVRRDAVQAEAGVMAARIGEWLEQLADEMAAVEPDPEARNRLVEALRGKVRQVRKEVAAWGEGPVPD